MKSLTVGKRIILGFSALIIIAIALGVTAIVQMGEAEEGATRLAVAYVPEVSVANNVERSLIAAMYANRGYAAWEEESMFREANEKLETTANYLGEARRLATAQNLEGMKVEEPKISKDVEEYKRLSDQTRTVIQRMQGLRARMDQTAGAFVQAGEAMIHQHEAGTERDLTERSAKVTYTEEVMNHGNTARVLNFKAQALDDMSYADEALEALEKASASLEKLVPITRAAEDIAMINATRTAIEDYGDAIRSYVGEFRKGDLASASLLEEYMAEMDSAAGAFARNSRSFFLGQVTGMQDNIRERVLKIGLVNDVIDLGNNARVNNFKSQALGEPPLMEAAIGLIDDMDEPFAQLEAIIHTAEGKANLKKTKEAALAYRAAMSDYLSGFTELQQLNDQRTLVGSNALGGAQNLAAKGMEETLGIAEESHSNLSTASGIMVTGLIIAAALGVVLALFITRSITGPLNLAISSLASGSSETSSAAGQVSSASQSLAEGASEQAASLEETSSSMEEMTSMVSRNAEVAKRTNEHAVQAAEAATDGVRSMGELRERADAVSVSAKEMEEAMQAIKASSDSISKIIKTIDEIAFQTNILALNAAVEAARAGEAGAGFAVVADEVRSLARRAAEAAQETASMIEDSMERSDRGVRVNETVGRNLAEVLQKAEQVENGLKSISATVSEVTGSMEELEASVREQQDGIGQINTAISQVNEVTQGNAASAEEAASAAEEMNAQSVNLLDIVGTLTEMVSGKRAETSAAISSNGSSRSHSAKARRITSTNSASSKSDQRETFSLPGDM